MSDSTRHRRINSESRPSAARRDRARGAARAWVEAHWFPLGVAAITIATAGFLFHQLLAWPPHEDEALPLLVGRHPLGELFQVVLEERGGAPLHFLLAWAVAQLDLGLAGLRALSAAFAVASLPVVALLAARLAGRARALVATARRRGELDVPLPRRVRADVQPLPAHEHVVVPRAAARAGARRTHGVVALGARDPGDGGDPSVRRARARVAGRVRRRRPARPAAGGALGVRRGRSARDPVLADRPRPRRPLRRGCRRRRTARRPRVRLARDRRLHGRLPGAARRARRGRRRPRRAPARDASADCVRRARAAGRARGRPQHGLPRDEAPDLPAPLPRPCRRRGPRPAGPRLGRRRARGPRRRAGRVGVGPDARALRMGA